VHKFELGTLLCKNEWQEPIECCRDKSNKDVTICLSGRPIIKSHDFDLKLPMRINIKYVVQYRNPMFSIASYYKLQKKKEMEFNISEKDFWDENYAYWESFMQKWAVNRSKNILLVNYDDIGYFSTIRKVANFIGLDVEKEIVVENSFTPKKTLYDKQFFKGMNIDEIENKISAMENWFDNKLIE